MHSLTIYIFMPCSPVIKIIFQQINQQMHAPLCAILMLKYKMKAFFFFLFVPIIHSADRRQTEDTDAQVQIKNVTSKWKWKNIDAQIGETSLLKVKTNCAFQKPKQEKGDGTRQTYDTSKNPLNTHTQKHRLNLHAPVFLQADQMH